MGLGRGFGERSLSRKGSWGDWKLTMCEVVETGRSWGVMRNVRFEVSGH